jgi:hypothetical protein
MKTQEGAIARKISKITGVRISIVHGWALEYICDGSCKTRIVALKKILKEESKGR